MESDLPLDFNSIKEEEFDKFVDYIVLDQPPDANNLNRAESSLPRNLKLKRIGKKVRVYHYSFSLFKSFFFYLFICFFFLLSKITGVKSAIYIPLGTRFGPLVGEVCVKEHAPNGKRKYFWRVSILKKKNLYGLPSYNASKQNNIVLSV